MKVSQFLRFSGILIVVTVVLFFIQNWIVNSIGADFIFYYEVWKIYIFHFCITFLILTALYFVGMVAPNYVGYSFLGFILIKMVAAVLFLLPLIKMENVSKIPDFISFFVPYFLFLFMEIVLSLRLLRMATTEK